jgi:hypothetical protein
MLLRARAEEAVVAPTAQNSREIINVSMAPLILSVGGSRKQKVYTYLMNSNKNKLFLKKHLNLK